MLYAKVVDVSKEKIDIAKAQKFIISSKYGASIYFVGTVRDQNNNKKVTGITYDTHDALVIKVLKKYIKKQKQNLNLKTLLYLLSILKVMPLLAMPVLSLLLLVSIELRHMNFQDI